MNNIDERDQAELVRIREFYDSVYYRDKKSTLPGRHEIALVRKLHIYPGAEILDIGCGSGEWLQACRDAGAKPTGVDISSTAIAICKATMPSGQFRVHAAEELPYASESFDFVTCLGSLEHFVQPMHALHEMSRVAKNNAWFLILVPNADFLTRKLRWYNGTYQVAANEVVRTLAEWETMFLAAGLSVEKRWRDLHILSWHWISKGKWYMWPVRLIQALSLPLWPLRWQYQVYHLCRKSRRA